MQTYPLKFRELDLDSKTPYVVCNTSERSRLAPLLLAPSVRGGLVYEPGWDCSGSQESIDGYRAAMHYFSEHM